MKDKSTKTPRGETARPPGSESRNRELAGLRRAVVELSGRLNALENRTDSYVAAAGIQSPVETVHPSTHKYSVVEALADEVIDSLNKEKACAFEPNGRPCDHCSMCSSRGF